MRALIVAVTASAMSTTAKVTGIRTLAGSRIARTGRSAPRVK
jgi:hypothetical protein